jgi:hypothetical protein
MVISCAIKGFLVHNVLVDTGSAADIIFTKAFRQMQELDYKIHDATHPLCGFRGRQIVALDKITMSVTFGYVHNIRTEQVVFDIVDMEYPYDAIIGRGTLDVTIPASSTLPNIRTRPITRSRAKQIQTRVDALLYEFKLNTNDNFMLPKSCMLLFLRFTKEEGQNISRVNKREELCSSQSSVTKASRRNSHIF